MRNFNNFMVGIFFLVGSLVNAAESNDIKLLQGHQSGKHFSIGYANGLWGKYWVQELNSKIPFWQHDLFGSFGLRLRTIAVQNFEGKRFDLGGRAELYGATPAFLNLVRLYGGGGYQFFYAVGAAAPAQKITHGFGGYFGFEFFLNDYMSFDIEIGGQGRSIASGATILAGVNFYPITRLFTSSSKQSSL